MEYNDLVLYRGKKYTIFSNYFNGHYEICSLNLKKTELVFVHVSELQKL